MCLRCASGEMPGYSQLTVAERQWMEELVASINAGTCQTVTEAVRKRRRRIAVDRTDALVHAPSTILQIRGQKPRQALQALREAVDAAPDQAEFRRSFQAQARSASILGSCPSTRSSLQSGVIASAC